jgi:hypothetical protein
MMQAMIFNYSSDIRDGQVKYTTGSTLSSDCHGYIDNDDELFLVKTILGNSYTTYIII